MNRDASGKVDVDEHGDGRIAGGRGARRDCRAGGRAVRAAAARRDRDRRRHRRRHRRTAQAPRREENGRRSRAVPAAGILGGVAVVDDQYADKVEAALVNSDKRINQAIDSGDYDELQKAIAKSQDDRCRAQSPVDSPEERPAIRAGPRRIRGKARPMKSIWKQSVVAVRSVLGVRRAGLRLERGRRLDDDHECRLCHRDLGERRLLVDHDLAGGAQVGRRLGEERSDEERRDNGGRRCEVGDGDARVRPEGARQTRHPAGSRRRTPSTSSRRACSRIPSTIENAVNGSPA